MNPKRTLCSIFLMVLFFISSNVQMFGQCGCSGPFLSLDMDRFPEDEFRIFGDTIEILGVARGEDCLFWDTLFKAFDVSIDTLCLSDLSLQITSPSFLVMIGDCDNSLPNIMWTLNAQCGQDSIIEDLSYKVYVKPVFEGFRDTLASLLNVDTVIKNENYFVCDTNYIFSVLDTYYDFCATGACQGGLYVDSPNFTCNTSAKVSTRRKKKNFSGGGNEINISGISNMDCDTYQYDFIISADCPYNDTASIFLVYCPDPCPDSLITFEPVPGIFPEDEYEFHGDTLVFTFCRYDNLSSNTISSGSYPEFTKDAFVFTGCDIPSVETKFEFTEGSEGNQFGVFNTGICPDTLPTVSWTAFVTCGNGDTTVLATQRYFLAVRSNFLQFDQFILKNTLDIGVDTFIRNGFYTICDTSVLDKAVEFSANFQICNSSVTVSTGRKKKKNVKGNDLFEKNDQGACDTFELFWVGIDPDLNKTCAFVDTASLFFVYCEDNTTPELQLVPDSFPPDLITIFDDPFQNVILIDSCFQFSGFEFDTTDAQVIGGCGADIKVIMELDPSSPFDFFQSGSCTSDFPTVTWTAIRDSAGVDVLVDEIKYTVVERSKFEGFAPQLATILNVPSVEPNGVYTLCDTSLFDDPLLDSYAFFQICNADVKVSSNRKKKNFKDDPLVKNGAVQCDTFEIEWATIDKVFEDNCSYNERVSIFLEYCPRDYLTLNMDSFPPDLYEFYNDTIAVLQKSSCIVEPEMFSLSHVIVDTAGLTDVNLEFISGDPVVGSACFCCLSEMSWVLNAKCGTTEITDSLNFHVYIKPTFKEFKDTLASILNVDKVIRNETYSVCDTNYFFNILESTSCSVCNDLLFVDTYPPPGCNAGPKVSNRRKKKSLSDGQSGTQSVGSSCDTFQIDWIIECLHPDTTTIFITQCGQPELEIIPDSFPDFMKFQNDTIAIIECVPNSLINFHEQQVKLSGDCNSSAQIQIGFEPMLGTSVHQSIIDFFNPLVGCNADSLPTLTWYAIANNGGVLDTLSTLPFKLRKNRIIGFSSQFADLMQVDTVIKGDTFFLCSDSIFQDSATVNTYVDYYGCNASTRISNRRKKRNSTNIVINSTYECDTFEYFWLPAISANDTICNYLEDDILELNIVIDDLAPEFSFTPPDMTIPAGTQPLFGTPIVEDNCVDPDITFVDEEQTIGNTTIYTRTWTADDGCQKMTTSQSITMVQASAIELHCPDDIEVMAQPGATEAIINWELPQAISDCSMGSTNCEPENIPGFNFMGEMNGMAYYISTVEKKWTNAKAHCEANGGRLAIVDSPEKNSFLAGSIGFFNAAFIGLTDEETEGIFEWIDGTTPFVYENWRPGSPDGGTVENYAAMHGWSNGLWGDYSFWTGKKYILEKSCTGNSGLNIEQVAGLPNNGMFPIGETTVTYEATDACGNSSSCSFTVIVDPTTIINCDDNLALYASASQSSTNQGGSPERAIDGNTNGNFYQDYSVSLTEWEDRPWWEAKLQKPKFIDRINLWNREDCCMEHTSGLYVLVSDVPYSSDDLDEILMQSGVSAFFVENQVGRPTTVSVKREGRYVRVQVNKQSFLGLAEVEVLGCDSNDIDDTPPINALFFDAGLRQGDRVLLRWAEQDMDSTDYFVVEKSNDAINFTPISERIQPGEGGINNLFSIYDANPIEGDNFYRLKVWKKNGFTHTAPIRKVLYEQNGLIRIYPNPANSTVNLHLDHFKGKDIKILFSNLMGKVVFEQDIQNLNQDKINIDLKQNQIGEGIYFVSVVHQGKARTKKIVVTKQD